MIMDELPERFRVVLACRECCVQVRAEDFLDWQTHHYSTRSNGVQVVICPHVPDGMNIQTPDRRRV